MGIWDQEILVPAILFKKTSLLTPEDICEEESFVGTHKDDWIHVVKAVDKIRVDLAFPAYNADSLKHIFSKLREFKKLSTFPSKEEIQKWELNVPLQVISDTIKVLEDEKFFEK